MNNTIYIYDEYKGTDVNLEISIFEYGLTVAKMEDEYHVIYGVGVGEGEFGEPVYNEFDHFTMEPAEIVELLDMLSDDDISSMNDFCDTNYSRDTVLNDIYDVIRFISSLNSYMGLTQLISPDWHTYQVEIIND